MGRKRGERGVGGGEWKGGEGEGGRKKSCVCVCEGGREERKDKEFCRVDMQRKTLP